MEHRDAGAGGHGGGAVGEDDLFGGIPLVGDHAGVRETLRDRRLSARSFTDTMVASGLRPSTAEQFTPLFRRHGDQHRVHRGLLAAAFTPRSVERLRPVAAAVAGRLADDLAADVAAGADGGGVEFVARFAAPLPPEVFTHLFGLPVEDRDRLAHWAEGVAPAFSTEITPEQVATAEQVADELRAYAAGQIARRRPAVDRGEPGDDLVSRLLVAEIDGDRLDDEDVIATMSGFIFAGAETTRRQLTAAIQVFAEHPDAWRRLQDEPDLIPNAVEEVLRHRGIIPGLSRVAVEPADHGGQHVEPGDHLAVVILTANADPSAFPDPDAFDVAREGADAHLTFGWGPHFCLGAGLARVEMSEALRALLDRFGPPVVSPAGASGSTGLTAPDELLVRFPPR